MREIGSRLNVLRYRPEAPNGFVLDRVRADIIEGKYFERNIVHGLSADPFGNEFQYDRIEFEQWQFRLTETQPGFELIGSTRGSRALANRLAEVCDLQLSVEEYTVDLMGWLNATVNELNVDGYVDIIQIASIDLGNGVIARSTIVGRTDVKDAVQRLVGSRSYSLSKLRYRLAVPGAGTMTLSSTASAALKLRDQDQAEDALRVALRQS